MKKIEKALSAGHLLQGKELWKQERFFEAYLHFLRALDQNPLCAEAMFRIGDFCSRYRMLYTASGGDAGLWAGVSVAADDAKQWYLRSAGLGFAEAQYELACELRVETGVGGPTAGADAEVWVRRAGKQGLAGANDPIQSRILKIRMEQCRHAVEEGDTEAERFHEWVGLFGFGLPLEWGPWQFTDQWLAKYQRKFPAEEARIPAWWVVRLPEPEGTDKTNPAEAGDPQALVERESLAISPAIAEALRSCCVAAVRGDLAAQMTLGGLYAQGQISHREHAQVVAPLSPRGDLDLILYLPDEYASLGCKEAAAYWWGKAAQRGSEPAASALAALEPLLLLERAKKIVSWSSGVHCSFATVEATKQHYAHMKAAVKLLRDAGYKVEHEGWGYKMEAIH